MGNNIFVWDQSSFQLVRQFLFSVLLTVVFPFPGSCDEIRFDEFAVCLWQVLSFSVFVIFFVELFFNKFRSQRYELLFCLLVSLANVTLILINALFYFQCNVVSLFSIST